MSLKHRSGGLFSKRSRLNMRSDVPLLIMALPGFAFFLLFHYVPMVGSLLAFKNFVPKYGIFGSQWTGLENFQFMFKNRTFWLTVRNTLSYNSVFLVSGILFPMVLAISLNEVRNKKLARVYQSLLIMPHFVNYAFQTTDKIYGSMNAISATSKDPARVMMFLNAICSDVEFSNLVAYGIEGQDWNRNEFGQIEKNNPATWNLYNAYYPAFIVAEPDTSLPPNMAELYEAFGKELVPSDNVGFAFDETPIMTQLSATRQVTAEYLDPLCKGLADPDEYLPKFLQALEDAGVDTIITELQDQLDAWRLNMGL